MDRQNAIYIAQEEYSTVKRKCVAYLIYAPTQMDLENMLNRSKSGTGGKIVYNSTYKSYLDDKFIKLKAEQRLPTGPGKKGGCCLMSSQCLLG